MQMKTLLAALVVAGLSVACGGDGGGDTPAATTSTVTLSGVAAKGLLRNAVVTAHAVKADGTVDTAVLATATTDANGAYTLPAFTATSGVPIVVRVTATAATRAVDEVSGTLVALPTDFVLRSVYVPTTTGPVSVTSHVTPFSELATAAAARATVGITAGTAAQAQVNVTALLGFDPTAVKPASIQSAQGPEQQALAVMLTAVSKLANDSGLGCNEAALGDRTQCVVEKLSESASLGSTKPGTVGGIDISAKLVESAVAVVNNPTLTQGTTVDVTTIGAVKSGLEGSGTPPVVSTSPAITAAKSLFTGLKSDFSELFSQGGVSSIAQGAANIQGFRFKTAMDGVQVPLLSAVADSSAILSGIDLYNDFKAGRSGNNRAGGTADDIANGNAQLMPNLSPVSCGVYDRASNDPAAVLAATPQQAVSIGCQSVFYARRDAIANGYQITRWRHGFTITPGADNTYTYSTIARRTVQTCLTGQACTQTANEALSASPSTGTVTTTLNGIHVAAFTIKGSYAATFKADTNELANASSVVDLAGSRTLPADKTSVASFSGSVVSKDGTGATVGTLTINSGSVTEIPVSADANGNEVAPNSPTAVRPFGGTFGAGAFDLTWATATAEFQGTMSLTESSWDKSLTSHTPTRGTFTGALRTIENGVKTEFMSGSLTLSALGYANYDARLADSSTNFYTTNYAFVGAITAPSRPKLELSISGSMRSNEDDPATVNLQYRSIVNNAPVRVIGAVATRQGSDYSVKLTEATSNLSMTWAPGATSATLYVNDTTVVGQLSKATKVLTFTDQSFVSLDIGL